MSRARANSSRSAGFSSRNARAGRPAQIHPAGTTRARLDPRARADAGAALDDDVVADARAHADQRVVADRAGSELHVVPDRDAGAEHEIAAHAVGRENAVVLHVGPRADDDPAVARANGAAEEDARVVGDFDVAGDDRRRRDERARRRAASGRAAHAAVRPALRGSDCTTSAHAGRRIDASSAGAWPSRNDARKAASSSRPISRTGFAGCPA